jgi:predicted Rossmann fold flavoprotein
MLKGLRVQGSIKIVHCGKVLREAAGEVLFAQDGLSGIAAMEVSREAAPGAAAVLDLLPEYSTEELTALLTKWQDCRVENVLSGLLPGRVAQAVVKTCARNSPEALAYACKNFTFEVIGTRGFEHAQVTAGGADVREFDAHTTRSKRVPGLYACGEALDVDGGCGGFNLHWAWASGVLAGRSAAL